MNDENNSKYAKGRQSGFDPDDVGSTPTLEKFRCKFCEREFNSKQALWSHTGKCKLNPNATNAELSEKQKLRNKNSFWRKESQPLADSPCPYCGRNFKFKYSLTSHIYGICCKENPKYGSEEWLKKHQARVKASKDAITTERRKAASERTVFNNFWKYRAKNPIIYESAIAGKMKLDSSWELLVAKRLDELNVEWYRPRVRLPYFYLDGVEHGYFPDFYVKTFNCFIEVKSDFIAKFQNSNNKCEYIKEHYPFIQWIETEDECSTFSLSDLKCDFVPQKDEEDISYWLNKIKQKEKIEP